MTTPAEKTRKMKVMLDSVALIISEALKRDDIGITGIDMGGDQVLVFTDSAGARQHLANALGFPPAVHQSRHRHQYRSGLDDRVRIYGKDYE